MSRTRSGGTGTRPWTSSTGACPGRSRVRVDDGVGLHRSVLPGRRRRRVGAIAWGASVNVVYGGAKLQSLRQQHNHRARRKRPSLALVAGVSSKAPSLRRGRASSRRCRSSDDEVAAERRTVVGQPEDVVLGLEGGEDGLAVVDDADARAPRQLLDPREPRAGRPEERVERRVGEGDVDLGRRPRRAAAARRRGGRRRGRGRRAPPRRAPSAARRRPRAARRRAARRARRPRAPARASGLFASSPSLLSCRSQRSRPRATCHSARSSAPRPGDGEVLDDGAHREVAPQFGAHALVRQRRRRLLRAPPEPLADRAALVGVAVLRDHGVGEQGPRWRRGSATRPTRASSPFCCFAGGAGGELPGRSCASPGAVYSPSLLFGGARRMRDC